MEILNEQNTQNEVVKTDNFIIISINGGVGKNILATAFVKAVKNQYPEMNIVILSAWKEVWLFNPNVYRCYTFQNSLYFYENFIKEKQNIKIFSIDPYQTESYILKKEHLINIWCNLYGIKFNGEKPELFFNQRETEFVQNNITKNDPILLIQSHGGADANNKHSWMRDLPIGTAQQIVDKFKGEIRIIHVRRDDQLPLQHTEQFKGGLRELFVLIRESKKRLFIDSMCQHAAAALEKPSVVCWVRNAPQVLGYSIHTNIVSDASDELNSLDFSLLEPYDISGNVVQCPFKEGTQLFNLEEIEHSLRNE